MPHFSADLLDALLDGDPAELEALRALLGAAPGRCAFCRPAPLAALLPGPTEAVPAATRRRRPAGDGEARGRRPRPPSGRPATVPRRRPLPG
ncbi:hypothetical protein DK419_24100 [Methylobacterium terrae]|uniref:Uncharacterized protein n=1 Tax=Methylobacterium terrae TaxID=2202827 RepID=A0A2U8WUX4_9HYPH|nr:hypothetical protein [Methylobacterium terrae]AWN49062.1 hypothetical protein DK419_24100 [Methylobacterium terrae]